MRRFFTVIVVTVLAISMLMSAAPASGEGISFFVKRNGNMRPIKTRELGEIEALGAYYIDKSKTDTDDDKVIYITFDAGYENGNIEKTLDILKEKQVPAAFFVLKYIVLKNTDLVKRMSDEGHLVCNHTKNHKDISTFSKEEIKSDLFDLDEAYKEKTGKDMARYFRFPEGKYSKRAIGLVNELGYTTVFWSFAYADWDNDKQPDKNKAYELIMNNTHNGEVILLHPTSSVNVELLPTLIDKWRKMGYRFGTLDELCHS